ncbi:MAG: SUMF1/EgtB/PvdO family nonheme iron enzyme [Candidatus Competibacter sp.]
MKGLALTLLVLLLPVAAAAAVRVALVIGNGAYADRPLRNPVNDAADLAAALERLGFQVLRYTDLDRKGMHRALQAFRDALRGKELGLFYYAGHGAQHHNRNYLIPVRAEIKDAADLAVEALEADSVLAQMQSAGNTVSVVILDACRNLPYSGADRAGERGLARLDAIRGSLVAYATGPGSVALDGDGRNSPYAAALLAEIGKPGVALTELFNNIGWAVARATNNAQEPWYSTSPLPKIYLAGGSVGQEQPIAGPTGELTVISQPPGAEVIVDGGSLGPAPQTLKNLKAGQQVTVDVRLEGYEPYREQVWIREGQRSERRVVLTKKLSPPAGPAMVRIKGGCFQMGRPAGEMGHPDLVGFLDDERQHQVCVKDFELGQNEVTVGEFRRFVDASGYQTDAERNAGGNKGCYAPTGEWKFGYRAEASWKNPSFQQGDTHPVVCVSWNDAVAYAEWLSQQTGQHYRLPTEAEWEYAARAGTTTARYWGDDPNQACRYANVYDQTSERVNHFGWEAHVCDDRWAQTSPVGSFQPNAWKLHDMLGNVLEWSCSVYDQEYGGAETKCTDKDTTGARAGRGGSWYHETDWVRSASRYRHGYTPSDRFYFLGFRLAKSL